MNRSTSRVQRRFGARHFAGHAAASPGTSATAATTAPARRVRRRPFGRAQPPFDERRAAPCSRSAGNRGRRSAPAHSAPRRACASSRRTKAGSPPKNSSSPSNIQVLKPWSFIHWNSSRPGATGDIGRQHLIDQAVEALDFALVDVLGQEQDRPRCQPVLALGLHEGAVEPGVERLEQDRLAGAGGADDDPQARFVRQLRHPLDQLHRKVGLDRARRRIRGRRTAGRVAAPASRSVRRRGNPARSTPPSRPPDRAAPNSASPSCL